MQRVSVTDLTLGASNFVVNESDTVALLNLVNNSQIVLDTSLDTVILSMAANSGPGGCPSICNHHLRMQSKSISSMRWG